MTRKDYIVIASALRHCEPQAGTAGHYSWLSIVAAISSTLKTNNPRFDTIHFVDVVTGKRPLESHTIKKVGNL